MQMAKMCASASSPDQGTESTRLPVEVETETLSIASTPLRLRLRGSTISIEGSWSRAAEQHAARYLQDQTAGQLPRVMPSGCLAVGLLMKPEARAVQNSRGTRCPSRPDHCPSSKGRKHGVARPTPSRRAARCPAGASFRHPPSAAHLTGCEHF